MATRLQLRKRILRHMDALNPDGTSSQRWDSSVGGEVDQRFGIVHSREWRRILNANPFYRFGKRTVTTDTDGRVLKTDLTSGSGNAVERFYRVLALSQDARVYQEVKFTDFPMGVINNYSGFVWYPSGSYLQLMPVVSGAEVTVWVNHIPCRADTLVDDGDTVTFPDDYEDILCLETASMLLAKGGAETQASAELSALAEQLRQDMLQDIARTSIKPTRVEYDDLGQDWAG